VVEDTTKSLKKVNRSDLISLHLLLYESLRLGGLLGALLGGGKQSYGGGGGYSGGGYPGQQYYQQSYQPPKKSGFGPGALALGGE
jgi:hypothetical protein